MESPPASVSDTIASLADSRLDAYHRELNDGTRPFKTLPDDLRERLGRAVRDQWVACMQRELRAGKAVRADHLLPWDRLDDRNKEIDREIGERVFYVAQGVIAGRMMESMGGEPGDGDDAVSITVTFGITTTASVNDGRATQNPTVDEAPDGIQRTGTEGTAADGEPGPATPQATAGHGGGTGTGR